MPDWLDEWVEERRAIREPPNHASNVASLPRPTNSDITPYANAALQKELDRLRATGEGSRNDQLNKAAFALGQLVAGGELPAHDVHDVLTAAARDIGLNPREITATLRSGMNAGAKHPRTTPPPKTLSVSEVTAAELNGSANRFWNSRDVLTHIREFAYARMCSPWAVLGICLLRALAVIPPYVVLPPLIGGYGSLNAFIALVGSSGVGKGASEAAAIDAVDFVEPIYTAPVGSGEGIAHQYAHRDRNGITRDRDSVLFEVSEVDTLTALGNRQGSTLLSQLRSAFSGERLGFGYADATKRIPIERHTYRLGMTVGVQAEKAGPIINDADGGTPQRFIWLPATDKHINPHPADPPPQWVVEKQTFLPGRDMFHVLTIPKTVEKTIRENHAARAQGKGEALDGHALFAREKIAQALTFLDQRRTMTEQDWELSGIIMDLSDITRAHVIATLQKQQQDADKFRAYREADRAIHMNEQVSEAATKRVAAKLAKLVGQAGETPWSELRRRISSRDRDYFEEAIERLVAAGQVRVEGTGHGKKVTSC